MLCSCRFCFYYWVPKFTSKNAGKLMKFPPERVSCISALERVVDIQTVMFICTCRKSFRSLNFDGCVTFPTSLVWKSCLNWLLSLNIFARYHLMTWKINAWGLSSNSVSWPFKSCCCSFIFYLLPRLQFRHFLSYFIFSFAFEIRYKDLKWKFAVILQDI